MVFSTACDSYWCHIMRYTMRSESREREDKFYGYRGAKGRAQVTRHGTRRKRKTNSAIGSFPFFLFLFSNFVRHSTHVESRDPIVAVKWRVGMLAVGQQAFFFFFYVECAPREVSRLSLFLLPLFSSLKIKSHYLSIAVCCYTTLITLLSVSSLAFVLVTVNGVRKEGLLWSCACPRFFPPYSLGVSVD